MQVAILCNHQKSISKTHSQQLEKIDQSMNEIRDAIKLLEDELDVAQGKKNIKDLKLNNNKDETSPKKKYVMLNV